jgi:hypothetical protein
MDRRTWFSGVIASVLGLLGWKQPSGLKVQQMEEGGDFRGAVLSNRQAIFSEYMEELVRFFSAYHPVVWHDQTFMRAIEECADVHECMAWAFRQNVMQKWGAQTWKQGYITPFHLETIDFYPELGEAIDKWIARHKPWRPGFDEEFEKGTAASWRPW